MVKYKNWYLAGEPGMKDERKKLKLIILQCIAVITANFITIWYFEELFFRGLWYVIFASFILTFIYIIRSFCCLRKIRVFWFAAIPVFLFGIYLAFLFNDGIKKLNFQVYKEKRTEIVQMVQNNQIKIRKDMELIELPEDYKKCSSGGEAVARFPPVACPQALPDLAGTLLSSMEEAAYSPAPLQLHSASPYRKYGLRPALCPGTLW